MPIPIPVPCAPNPTTRDRDRLARGPDPRSRVPVPAPDERCPRCHRGASPSGTHPCLLCRPWLVPAVRG